MQDHVEQTLIAPRYLAGGGDPAWITVPVHRACGWSFGHDPLMPRVHLTSPNQRTLLRIDPDPDDPWWTIRHAGTGSQRSWSASFGARTPVEIIAGFTDALTDPAAIQAPTPGPGPFEALRQAGWREARDHDGLTSPEGYAHVEHFAHSGSNRWFIQTAVSGDPEGLIWSASLDGNIPRHLITGLTRALADENPLPRDPHRLPAYGRSHIRATTHQVRASVVAFALENRVNDLTARQTNLSTPALRPPHRPPPGRTR